MPRKPTGKSGGRPRSKLGSDGQIDPATYKPSPAATRALNAELHFYNMQERGRADDGHWPVLASALRIANRAKVTQRAVQKWRAQPWYECHFWSAVISQLARQREQQKRKARKPIQVINEPLAAWLSKGWPKGGVVSPINRRRYHSPQTFARHIQAQPGNLVPFDWFRWPDPVPGI